MTTTEKCRMLLELAKKSDRVEFEYAEKYQPACIDYAETESVEPTTIAEICEAYLEKAEANEWLKAEAYRSDASHDRLVKRIQELEVENAALLARKCSHGDYKHWGTDGCMSCETGRIDMYILEKTCLSCREALAKARKVGG